MTVWRAWDADDDEYAEALVIREMLPLPMRAAANSWLRTCLESAYGHTDESSVNAIQSALRVDLGLDTGRVDTEQLVESIERHGDRVIVRVIDFCLSDFSPTDGYHRMPPVVESLKWHFDQNMSSVCVQLDGDCYRIARRLPAGVEELAQEAVATANEVAGRHLSKGWSEAQSLTPDTSAVMTEAIRAVEAAAGAVVTPNDRRPRMGKIVGALRDNTDWTLVLATRDDGHPDQRIILIGMIEALVFAEQHRHSGADPSALEALTHIQLASTLVAWFSMGSVTKLK